MTLRALPSQRRYEYSPIIGRPRYDWPDGKRLAVYVALNIETFAFRTGIGNDPVNRGAAQNQRNFGWRDYGNRVGVWRLFDLLEDLGWPCSVLLNSVVCEQYPEIVRRVKQRNDDIVAHGRTNAELHSPMWEDDEARVIDEVTHTIERHMGVRPTGWLGPAADESAVTPDLLAEAGYTHCMDWPSDDQPFWMTTRTGRLLSIPYPYELNDISWLARRDQTGQEFADMIVDQFDEMVEQSEREPLVLALAIHGFVVGQPFRLRPLRRALLHCANHPQRDRVWFTTAGAIAGHCFALPDGVLPGSNGYAGGGAP